MTSHQTSPEEDQILSNQLANPSASTTLNPPLEPDGEEQRQSRNTSGTSDHLEAYIDSSHFHVQPVDTSREHTSQSDTKTESNTSHQSKPATSPESTAATSDSYTDESIELRYKNPVYAKQKQKVSSAKRSLDFDDDNDVVVSRSTLLSQSSSNQSMDLKTILKTSVDSATFSEEGVEAIDKSLTSRSDSTAGGVKLEQEMSTLRKFPDLTTQQLNSRRSSGKSDSASSDSRKGKHKPQSAPCTLKESQRDSTSAVVESPSSSFTSSRGNSKNKCDFKDEFEIGSCYDDQEKSDAMPDINTGVPHKFLEKQNSYFEFSADDIFDENDEYFANEIRKSIVEISENKMNHPNERQSKNLSEDHVDSKEKKCDPVDKNENEIQDQILGDEIPQAKEDSLLSSRSDVNATQQISSEESVDYIPDSARVILMDVISGQSEQDYFESQLESALKSQEDEKASSAQNATENSGDEKEVDEENKERDKEEEADVEKEDGVDETMETELQNKEINFNEISENDALSHDADNLAKESKETKRIEIGENTTIKIGNDLTDEEQKDNDNNEEDIDENRACSESEEAKNHSADHEFLSTTPNAEGVNNDADYIDNAAGNHGGAEDDNDDDDINNANGNDGRAEDCNDADGNDNIVVNDSPAKDDNGVDDAESIQTEPTNEKHPQSIEYLDVCKTILIHPPTPGSSSRGSSASDSERSCTEEEKSEQQCEEAEEKSDITTDSMPNASAAEDHYTTEMKDACCGHDLEESNPQDAELNMDAEGNREEQSVHNEEENYDIDEIQSDLKNTRLTTSLTTLPTMEAHREGRSSRKIFPQIRLTRTQALQWQKKNVEIAHVAKFPLRRTRSLSRKRTDGEAASRISESKETLASNDQRKKITRDPASKDSSKRSVAGSRVVHAPPPNLKNVKSRVNSLSNASYKPGGGRVKIESRRVDVSKATARVQAKSDYKPGGSNKKIEHKRTEWKAESKVGSLANAGHKPGGGNVKIDNKKLNFSEQAEAKVGSKENADYKPSGSNIKIINQPLELSSVSSRVGSLDNVDHKPQGGRRRIYNDVEYLRQVSAQQQHQQQNRSRNHCGAGNWTTGAPSGSRDGSRDCTGSRQIHNGCNGVSNRTSEESQSPAHSESEPNQQHSTKNASDSNEQSKNGSAEVTKSQSDDSSNDKPIPNQDVKDPSDESHEAKNFVENSKAEIQNTGNPASIFDSNSATATENKQQEEVNSETISNEIVDNSKKMYEEQMNNVGNKADSLAENIGETKANLLDSTENSASVAANEAVTAA